MNEYSHHVSGFFANREEAQNVFTTLIERGVPGERLQLFDTDTPALAPAPQEDRKAVLKDVLVDGTIGTAVGAGLGGLAQVALVAANVSLFIASPLLAPLAMLGWGASIGGLLGATVGATKGADDSIKTGADKKEGGLSDLVRDAIASEQTVLVVRAQTEQEAAIAREVIQASVGDYKEVAPT